MKIIRAAALIPAAATLLLSTPAGAESSTVYHEGRCHASGKLAECSTDPSNPAYRPASIHAWVSASPDQPVELNWLTDCFTASGASSSNSGDKTLKAPYRLNLKLPMRNPGSCYVFATASLGFDSNFNERSGYIALKVTYRKRT